MSVTMSMMTCFILRAHTGTGFNNSHARKDSEEVLEKNAGEWTGRVEILKEEIPGSRCSVHSYIGPARGLKWRNFELWVLN